MAVRFFRLRDEYGIAADGSLEPIVEVGLAVVVPALDTRGRIVERPTRIVVRSSSADGRVIATDDPRVAGALLASGQYDETDPPEARTAKDRAALDAELAQLAEPTVEEPPATAGDEAPAATASDDTSAGTAGEEE